MVTELTTQQYVVLPTRGLRANPVWTGSRSRDFLITASFANLLAVSRPSLPSIPMRVLDSIHPDGAKLIEMTPEAALALRTEQPGLRIIPVVYYMPARLRPTAQSPLSGPGNATVGGLSIGVVSQTTSLPIVGATVCAFTDYVQRYGATAITDSAGVAQLSLDPAVAVERVCVYPKQGFWGTMLDGSRFAPSVQIKLEPIDLSYPDALRALYGNSPETSGQAVTVGVVDTGIATGHSDLRVDGGENTVVGEDSTAIGDNGDPHGTHVAGIIAARGQPPSGLRGLAPAVKLRCYRVFGQNNPQASSYSIAKAIDRAAADGCDLINLSLTGPSDEATNAAIADARSQGSVVIVAAGNDNRAPVSFPAAFGMAIAVSAMGRNGTFPDGSIHASYVALPSGTDKRDFIASFSNVGPQVALTGPGVGILSTVPGGYAAMDGTSMACPAVTGLAARILAAKPDLLSADRNQNRSDAIVRVILQSGHTLGFAAELEGRGLPSDQSSG